MSKYQDIYPSEPLIQSIDLVRPTAADLLTLEYFEAEPASMPTDRYSQHHIILNLREEPHRLENWRDGEHRDFIYNKNEIILTPAGVESGWRWHVKSKCIIITLDPAKFERFAQTELGILLSTQQLKDLPQFFDEDITQSGIQLLEALQSKMGSQVMFESFARVFLTKLILKYGLQAEEYNFSKSFTAEQYKQVLNYIAINYGSNILLEDMAAQADLSTSHFSRLFKQTIGQSPYQFLMSYRIEQAKKMLDNPNALMIDIAMNCGFSDQAHFSRVFKKIEGITPKKYRRK
ncbi:helix-turn-helix transcriptional regulator [Pleurocapsales cyanobacterium LEGE 10410]|nr:helix-turn-helix transcriptional regulator [Pleurocapsales cyanobacterium LEGE 10410]